MSQRNSTRKPVIALVATVLECDRRTRRAAQLLVTGSVCLTMLLVSAAVALPSMNVTSAGILGTSVVLLARSRRSARKAGATCRPLREQP